MSHFKNKYLKYKSKYLQLLNLKYNQIGGDLPIIHDEDSINSFTDPEMEKYMNPIHGFILCNKGTIPNNYWLYKDGLINTLMGILIKKVCKNIPGSVQPTKYLMDLEPIDFGRYIALKYINMKINMMTGNKLIQINKAKKIFIDPQLIKNEDKRNELIGFINKIRTYIPFLDNDIFTFHIILYCLWWNANNDNGIVEYYNGIKEIFDFLNKLPSIQLLCIKPLVLKDKCTPPIPNSFEKTVIKITHKEFKIYSQEQAQDFCNGQIITRYPDCGEITALNLINLLCFNGVNFDIKKINKSPIPELLEFYRIFKNFNSISDVKFKPEIFCKHLNARDAWSYLIINYAKNNLEFVKDCTKLKYKFELITGLNSDKSTSNFLQLIKNLLGIEKWEDLENDNIKNIKDDTKNGIGYITITHNTLGEFIIHCELGHYFIKQEEQRKVEEINLEKFTKDQITNINILLKKEDITLDNYLHIDFNSEFLEIKFNSYFINPILKIKLFELSLTNKYDSDLRRRIGIDVDADFFKNIVINYGDKKNIDEYTYKCKNFDFVLQLSAFTHLNFYDIKKHYKLENIDLSSLYQLKFIGDKFMYNYSALKSIDLSSLSLLQSIGNYFMYNCESLTSIVLPTNSQLTSIGNFFMNGCANLTSIDLSSLSQLKSIENSFMNGWASLTNIDLSSLSNVESIGNYFMNNCLKLININFFPCLKFKSISDGFMSQCIGLKSIDLSSLSNLKSIGDYFMGQCQGLESIIFPTNSQLESIGNKFMSECIGLISINLSSLSNLKSIGNDFMDQCNRLKSIDLSGLSNLKSIGNDFMSGCDAIENIILPTNSQLESIKDNFMHTCKSLKIIVLSSLSQLKSIGNSFMKNCQGLERIDLSPLSNLESIGNDFMKNCNSLLNINLHSLSKLNSVGDDFMSKCYILSNIDLSSLINLYSIGENFLLSCNKLESIDLSSLSNLNSIGKDFMNVWRTPTIICSNKHKDMISPNSNSLYYQFIIIE